MLSVYGGALWRYLYNKGRGQSPKVEWMNPGGATHRGIAYTLFYMWGRKALGVKETRMIMTLFHVTWEMLMEATGQSFDPFAPFFKILGDIFAFVAALLRLNMERTKPKPTVKED